MKIERRGLSIVIEEDEKNGDYNISNSVEVSLLYEILQELKQLNGSQTEEKWEKRYILGRNK